jgi:hypothetical protein
MRAPKEQWTTSALRNSHGRKTCSPHNAISEGWRRPAHVTCVHARVVRCFGTEDPLPRFAFGSSERAFVVSEFDIPALEV